MTDKEKVIRGLEAHANPKSCETCAGDLCPYYYRGGSYSKVTCSSILAADALALLKEQEARVMTLEEVKQHDNQDGCVWFEQPTYNAVAAFVRQDEDCTEIISPYLLGEPINHGYMSNTFYAKAWRAWTSRPTEEQRKAVPWEDDDA